MAEKLNSFIYFIKMESVEGKFTPPQAPGATDVGGHATVVMH